MAYWWWYAGALFGFTVARATGDGTYALVARYVWRIIGRWMVT